MPDTILSVRHEFIYLMLRAIWWNRCYHSHLQMKNGSIEKQLAQEHLSAPVRTGAQTQLRSPRVQAPSITLSAFTPMAGSVGDFYRIAIFLTVIVLLLWDVRKALSPSSPPPSPRPSIPKYLAAVAEQPEGSICMWQSRAIRQITYLR